MRYAVLADIHGNLHALRAVLAALRTERIDGYLVAGDLVGYGAFPNECIEVVAALDPVCVAGNHDLMAQGILSPDRCIPIARHSIRWTREILNDDSRRFLATLPLSAQAEGGVVLAHGSLDDPEAYTRRPAEAVAQLERIGRAGASVLVLGHTHRPLAVDLQGRRRRGSTLRFSREQPVMVNPGAVGQSRGLRTWARYGILDTDRGEWRFGAARYDVGACRAALRRVGLSPRGCHLPPSVLGVGRRLARRVIRRARRPARGT